MSASSTRTTPKNGGRGPQPPIASLPNELISEIFLLLCQPPPFRGKLVDYTSPLLFGGVCRRWREIAWNLPNLWRFIFLIASSAHYGTQTELLEEWLERSKDCPLSIVFRLTEAFEEGVMEEPEEGPHEMFSLFAQESRRLEALDVVLPTQECTDILDAARTELPILRTVALRCHAEDLDVRLLEYLPLLTHLSLAINSYITVFPAPSHTSLTTLTLRNFDITQAASIMGEAVNLRFCELQFIDSEGYFEMEEPMSFPMLESLVVHACGSNHTLGLFDQVPKLRELRMSGTGFPDLPVIDRFFNDHSFKLETFHMTLDFSMKADRIRNLLRHHSQSLTTLSFHHHSHAMSPHLHDNIHLFLGSKEDGASEPFFLPKLRHYEYFPPENSFPMECVARMLQERWKFLRTIDNSESPRSNPIFSARFPKSAREELSAKLAKEMEEVYG